MTSGSPGIKVLSYWGGKEFKEASISLERLRQQGRGGGEIRIPALRKQPNRRQIQ